MDRPPAVAADGPKSDRLLRAGKDREVYFSARAQAIRMTAEVPVLLGKTLAPQSYQRLEVERGPRTNQTLKLSPHPHSPLAFGF
jgi:hypothetical protein